MKAYNLLAALFDYPSDDLLAALREDVAAAGDARALVAAADAEGICSAEEQARIAAFIEWMLGEDATLLQSNYVQTFDLTPEHSLHLTHHLFGDDKNRGPALIDLSEYFKSYGFALKDERELPDYLPLLLEFVSQLGRDEAAVFLADVAKVLKVLAGNLEEAGSTWAPLARVIENHGSLTRLAA